jgi:hypothetical protein
MLTAEPNSKIENRSSTPESRANEAKGQDNAVIVQNEAPVALTANSGVDLGLDKQRKPPSGAHERRTEDSSHVTQAAMKSETRPWRVQTDRSWPSAYRALLSAAYDPLPTAYCVPPTAYCPLPTAYRLLRTAYCLLRTAYCLLRTGCCLLSLR